MTDITNPKLIPSVKDIERDKLLSSQNERLEVTVKFVGNDSLEVKKAAGKLGLSPKNYVYKVTTDAVRVARKHNG